MAAALHTAWRALPRAERLERSGWLPRSTALVPFREDLLALGQTPSPWRRIATELLALFRDDPVVLHRLSAWMADDLARFELDAAEPGEERRTVLRIQGELRALAWVDAEASVPVLEDALVRSLGRSPDVGMVAAAALGRTAAGRARLARHLGPEVDRRTRIEGAIALAPFGGEGEGGEAGGERAVLVLIQDYPRTAWDLRARMIQALGRAASPRAREFLARIALDEDQEVEDRRAALAELAGSRSPEAVAILEAATHPSQDLEVRRSALAFL